MDLTKLHVLVIDDEEFTRRFMEHALEAIGVNQISSAEHGRSAIQKIVGMASPPDVILCDLEMPTMNGFEFVVNLRALEEDELSKIPVVIVTGHDADIAETVSKLEINGFATKPMSPATLSTHLEKALLSMDVA